jgi:hypothetical protein
MYLGDIRRTQPLFIPWPTVNQAGASVTPSVAGTIVVYRANNTTEFTTGVSDTRTFDGKTGIHFAEIDTSDTSQYIPGNDFFVALLAATIDSQVVNVPIGSFSIENRTKEITRATAVGVAAQAITLAAGDGGADQSQKGMIIEAFTATTGAQQQRTVVSNIGDVCQLDRAWAITPTGTIVYKKYMGSLGLTLTEIGTQLVADEAAHPFDAAGTTVEGFRRLLMAVLGGRNSGPTPGVAGTVIFRDLADDKDVAIFPVDTNGYRSADPTFDLT